MRLRVLNLDEIATPPAGFGNCKRCDYYEKMVSPEICLACAYATIDLPAYKRCHVCDQTLTRGSGCDNYWCQKHESERGFRRVYAIGMNNGALKSAISSCKSDDQYHWAAIFGRIVVGYLDASEIDDYDLIVASPTYAGTQERRRWDHIGAILDAARQLDPHKPFDCGTPRTIVKTAETPQMKNYGSTKRREIGETRLRSALKVPDPRRVSGKTILVFDDIFTEGTTLREIALKLRDAGATRVDGLVLGRQPWRW